jgi:hypothetical protein
LCHLLHRDSCNSPAKSRANTATTITAVSVTSRNTADYLSPLRRIVAKGWSKPRARMRFDAAASYTRRVARPMSDGAPRGAGPRGRSAGYYLPGARYTTQFSPISQRPPCFSAAYR